MAGEFHTLLASTTGNATPIRYVNDLVARSSLIVALYGRHIHPNVLSPSITNCFAKLKSGDTAKAIKLMMQHLVSITIRTLLPKEQNSDIGDVLASYAAAEGLPV